jgi:two-component system, chemotaxis family, CheB/CheR fusion protein
LAKSHSLLVDSDWEGVDLGALIRQQLEPYMVGGQERLKVEGEPVTLPPDMASPFGLVLHELATNAAKYGALSQPAGKVFMSWSIAARNQRPILKFVWRELGGPQVKEPDHTGYGTSVIEKGVPEATVHREFSPEGVVFTIEFPLKAASAVSA